MKRWGGSPGLALALQAAAVGLLVVGLTAVTVVTSGETTHGGRIAKASIVAASFALAAAGVVVSYRSDRAVGRSGRVFSLSGGVTLALLAVFGAWARATADGGSADIGAGMVLLAGLGAFAAFGVAHWIVARSLH